QIPPDAILSSCSFKVTRLGGRNRRLRYTGLYGLKILRLPGLSHVKGSHDHNSGQGYTDCQIVLPREPFLQEDPAPNHRDGAVRGDDGGGHGQVALIGNGKDISKLTGGFKRRADVFGNGPPGYRLFPTD